MRILLILALLCSSLTACSVFAKPIERPPEEQVTALDFVLSAQAKAHKSFLDTADAILSHDMNGGQVFGVALGSAIVLKVNAEILERDFHPSLSAHVDIAKTQHQILSDICKLWLVDKTMRTANVAKELSTIET